MKDADLFNNSIFLDKKWDLLDYFDAIGFSMPIKLIHDKNILNTSQYIIPEFNLSHHTQYNFMRQEQSMIKKKLNIDYIKTYNNDLINIYYNIKRFKIQNKEAIELSNARTKKKKSISSIQDNKYKIENIYIKIINKIDELLL